MKTIGGGRKVGSWENFFEKKFSQTLSKNFDCGDNSENSLLFSE